MKKSEKSYSRLLKKLHLVEIIGMNFYGVLAKREKDAVLKKIYTNLSLNEDSTGKLIEAELKALSIKPASSIWSLIPSVLAGIFNILPLRVLKNVLEAVLAKRIYSKYSSQYKKLNTKLWCSLVEHEELQCRLLAPYFHRN